MRLKKVTIWTALSILLVFIYAISSNAASLKYVAKVNKAKINNLSLEAAVTSFIENQKMLGVNINQEDTDSLRKDVLEELIAAELLYQESKKAGLGNLGKEVNEQLERIKKGFPSKEEFNNALKERGITIKDLKEDIKKGTYIKRFLEKDIYAKVSINEAEKKAEYEKNKDRLDVPERVKASHILIKVAPDASGEDKAGARKRVEDLRKRILAGDDFAKLAKENSQDGSASRGGDLGYFKRGDMVKPFEDAAFSLENGKISDVIETQFGYHIVKVIDKKSAHTLVYTEVEKDIESFLLNKRQQEAVSNLVEELKKNAEVERYIE